MTINRVRNRHRTGMRKSKLCKVVHVGSCLVYILFFLVNSRALFTLFAFGSEMDILSTCIYTASSVIHVTQLYSLRVWSVFIGCYIWNKTGISLHRIVPRHMVAIGVDVVQRYVGYRRCIHCKAVENIMKF